ncbi:dirigent protein [Spartinivicinus poritis]|uniref:Dirigent protein n=1 Tax=Spartinivicinus poritis TaxID=2994640 RepID=A0ABT5UE60_9GAMM|nr:dirigent protein [Spartinivicinus sp. A2-2]MDE1464658.1 dirigent protein [Spartinivicinus sp. A2-2]
MLKKCLLSACIFGLSANSLAEVNQMITYADIRENIGIIPGNIRQNAETEDRLDSPGDIFVFDQILLGENGKDIMGRNAGFCIRTDPGMPDFSGTDHPSLPDDPKNNHGQCQWSLVFSNAGKARKGSIQVAGRESDIGLSELTIIGGTGDFVGIKGVLCSTPEPQNKRFKQVLVYSKDGKDKNQLRCP